MVRINLLSSFHLYYIYGSRMYTTHIKYNSRNLYVVSKILQSFFLKIKTTLYKFLEIMRLRYDNKTFSPIT